MCDTSAQTGSVPFEYHALLVDGPEAWQPTAQVHATRWANAYSITSPILHRSGQKRSAMRSCIYFVPRTTNAFEIARPRGSCPRPSPG